MARKKNRSKYGVDISAEGKKKRTAIDRKTGKEFVFDSLLEMRYYIEVVCAGLDDGTIIDYDLQKRYKLQPSFKRNGVTVRAIDYVADFWIKYADGSEKVIDTKGGRVDSAAKLKKKMMYYIYPDVDYQWMYHTKATGWIDWDEYEAIKRKRKKEKKDEEIKQSK